MLDQLGLIGIADVVVENAGKVAGFRLVATVLTGGALQDGDERLAIRKQRKTFEALIVLAAGFRVARLGRLGSRSRCVCGEMILALALGDQRLRRTDRRDHLPIGREAINVGAVFVADEEAAVLHQNDGFRIERDPSIRDLRQRRNIAGCRLHAAFRRVEAAHRLALVVGQQDRVFDLQCDWAAFRGKTVASRGRLQRDAHLVKPVTIIRGALNVVATIGKDEDGAGIAVAGLFPAFQVHSHAGTRAEGLAEFVLHVRRQPADADQALVDKAFQRLGGGRASGEIKRRTDGQNGCATQKQPTVRNGHACLVGVW